jgi:hypothetical protein
VRAKHPGAREQLPHSYPGTARSVDLDDLHEIAPLTGGEALRPPAFALDSKTFYEQEDRLVRFAGTAAIARSCDGGEVPLTASCTCTAALVQEISPNSCTAAATVLKPPSTARLRCGVFP